MLTRKAQQEAAQAAFQELFEQEYIAANPASLAHIGQALGRFPSGVTLRVEARCELIGSNGLGMFDCRILLAGDTVATARVSVFEPPEGADLFAGPANES